MPPVPNPNEGGIEVTYNGKSSTAATRGRQPPGSVAASNVTSAGAPVDLDDLFADDQHIVDLDDETTLFSDTTLETDDDEDERLAESRKFFYDPYGQLLGTDASFIPGSPF